MTNHPGSPNLGVPRGFPQEVSLPVLKLGKFWVNWDKLVTLVLTKANHT